MEAGPLTVTATMTTGASVVVDQGTLNLQLDACGTYAGAGGSTTVTTLEATFGGFTIGVKVSSTSLELKA